MKKIVLGISILVLSLGVIGCGESTEAEMSSSFQSVSSDRIGKANIHKIKDKDTGCYFILSGTSYSGTASAQNI